MIGRILSLAMVAVGAVASLAEREATVTQSGNTITLSGISSDEIIIIQTNSGGGAGWNNVNPSMATGGKTHKVTVGGPGRLFYDPESVMAAVGDIIEFNFMAKNHSVTQSTFAKPCINAKMFDTGFVPNAGDVSPPPAMRVQVNSTAPSWFYCRQKTHCGKGMVFSVNPTAEKSHSTFKASAMAQNGTASAVANPASPPAAGSAPVATPASVSAPPSASVASGTGSVGSNGACSCSCLCGAGSFGDLSTQGKSAFGGFGGMLSPPTGGS